MHSHTSRTIDIMFLVMLALVPVLSIPWHSGIGGCDPASYVLSAKKFATSGELEYYSLFGAPRIMAWIFHSGFISIFGVTPGITWVNIFQFCLLLVVLYWFLRKYDQVVAFYSTALLAFSTFLMRESTMVMGDITLTLLVNLPLLMYWRCTEQETTSRPFRMGAIAGVFWVAAFFTKESAVYYLVVCLFFLALAWRHKNKTGLRFWGGFWAMIAAGMVITSVWFYFAIGEPFHKFTMANNAIARYSLDMMEKTWKTWEQLTAKDLVYRYTLQPFTFFILDYTMGLLGMLSLFFLWHYRKFSKGFWGLYLIVPMVVWWFFPQRLDPFYPMRLTYRLWLPVMVPLAIAAGHGLKLFVTSQETKWDRLLVFLAGSVLIGVSSLFFARGGGIPHLERIVFYSIALGFILLATFVKENAILPDLRKVTLIAVLLPFFYAHFNRFEWRGSSKTEHESAIHAEQLLEARNAQTALVHPCLVPFYRLYDSNIQFVPYEDSVERKTLHDVYLMIDKTHEEVSLPDSGFVFIEENERYRIYYRE